MILSQRGKWWRYLKKANGSVISKRKMTKKLEQSLNYMLKITKKWGGQEGGPTYVRRKYPLLKMQ